GGACRCVGWSACSQSAARRAWRGWSSLRRRRVIHTTRIVERKYGPWAAALGCDPFLLLVEDGSPGGLFDPAAAKGAYSVVADDRLARCYATLRLIEFH